MTKENCIQCEFASLLNSDEYSENDKVNALVTSLGQWISQQDDPHDWYFKVIQSLYGQSELYESPEEEC